MSSDQDHQNAFLQFFGRPVVGIAGSIASVVGLGLSVYFFLAARETSKLTYFVHPAKAAVVRTGQTSRLVVQFDGQNLTGDVTAAQVAFWNAGTKAIRGSAILSPLLIRTSNRSRILEVRLQKTSRDVVGLKLDASRLASGEVAIRWNILEHNDGGVLQVVYAGNEAVKIQAHAVLEGQPEIVHLDYASALSSPGEEYARRQGLQARIGYRLIVVGSTFIVLVLALLIYARARRITRYSILLWAVVPQGLASSCP